ncbi:MAG: PrsW family intramembrane metalloprotease [Caldilineaceae bacterium]
MPFIAAYAEFDDSLDGLIYGAMVGFGFAMTENFLYFVSSFDAGAPGQFTFLVFLRSILFGINHALYTGLTGLSFGLARNSPRPYAGWLYPLLGLLAAIFVHGLHNFGITLVSASWTNIVFSAALAIIGMTLLPVTVWVMWQKQRAAFWPKSWPMKWAKRCRKANMICCCAAGIARCCAGATRAHAARCASFTFMRSWRCTSDACAPSA